MKDLKRRDFIKYGVIAGVGTSVVPELLQAGQEVQPVQDASAREMTYASPADKKKVIVAGAGITGLCCAYELMKSGHDVVVLEATGRHGGHVFTGRDGMSDGLYADYGADHITQPGYEAFFEYTKELNLEVLPYPQGKDVMKMIGGKFYTEEMLADPKILKTFGFNEKEIGVLSKKPWWALKELYLKPYLSKFKDANQPFGVGYDDLDTVPIADIYKKEGASEAALRYLGGRNSSALYTLWRMAIMYFRGIPLSEGDTFRLKGGNQEMPNAFAKKLGSRVRMGCPITAIRHTDKDVTVTYKEFGYAEEKQMTADFLVNCISMPVFKNIPVSPALSPQKQYVVDNLGYSSHPHCIFIATSKFWLDDGFKSINMQFEHPDISATWQTADEVESSRVAIVAYCPGGLSPQRVLASFREVYPGKRDTIVQALTKDWTTDKFAPTCEMLPFPMGTMSKFWPEILKPNGRLYFAGTYADNMSRGMESCVRSARRVAKEIDQA